MSFSSFDARIDTQSDVQADSEPRTTAQPSESGSTRNPALRTRIGFRDSSERKTLLDWLNTGLRPGRPGRLQSEYPQIFDSASRAEPITTFSEEISGETSEETPVAHATLLPTRARIRGAALRVGLVSLVFTDPAHRGQGLASAIVDTAMTRARETGLGLVLLWSDLDRLYRPLGFERLGQEALLVVDRGIVERALAESVAMPDAATRSEEALEVGAPTGSDWPAIAHLREARTTGLELQPEIFSRMAGIPGLDVRVARRNGRPSAFAMRGRGDDLAEVIHDWGGEADDVLACCLALLVDNAPHEELLLLAPPTPESVPWLLRRAGARIVRQPLAWMRMACPAALISDVAPLVPELGQTDPQTIDEQRLLRKLFGAPETASRGLARSSDLEREPGSELPLPLFVWGMESI